MFSALLPLIMSLLDRILPDPKARDAAKAELMKQENQAVLQEAQVQLSAILAEEQSADPWTSRARPTFLYIMYMMILLCVVGGLIGIWYPAQVNQAAANMNALLRALPDELYTLFGIGYLGYTGARSFDKWREIRKR